MGELEKFFNPDLVVPRSVKAKLAGLLKKTRGTNKPEK